MLRILGGELSEGPCVAPTNGSTTLGSHFHPVLSIVHCLHRLPAVCGRCCMAQAASILSAALYALNQCECLFVALPLAQPCIQIVLAPDPGLSRRMYTFST